MPTELTDDDSIECYSCDWQGKVKDLAKDKDGRFCPECHSLLAFGLC